MIRSVALGIGGNERFPSILVRFHPLMLPIEPEDLYPFVSEESGKQTPLTFPIQGYKA